MSRVEERDEGVRGSRLVCSELGEAGQNAVACGRDLRAGEESAVAVEAGVAKEVRVVSGSNSLMSATTRLSEKGTW